MEPANSKPFELATGEFSRLPDQRRVQADIHYSSNENRFVKRLTRRRSNLISHRSLSHSRRGTDLLAEFPLNLVEVEQLLEGAFEIFNTYNEAFRETFLSRQIVGHDDFRFILEAVRHSLDRIQEAPEF